FGGVLRVSWIGGGEGEGRWTAESGHRSWGASMQLEHEDERLTPGEIDAERLTQETGDPYTSVVIREFSNEDDARTFKEKLIGRFRRLFGGDALPGNRADE
ncbi:MAG: hypothetical protein VX528_17575, partial [Candidatus Latescibacterota bacterium]|nr:hypothetical protein [Candidatus Latescibacterota bacterium]